jgi:hypothetical protein
VVFAHLGVKASSECGLVFGLNQLICHQETLLDVLEETFALGKRQLEEMRLWAKQLAKLNEGCAQRLATAMLWTLVNPPVVVGQVFLVEVDLPERVLWANEAGLLLVQTLCETKC